MESTQSQTQTIHNLFVNLLNGKTLTLKFNSPKISGETLIHKIQSHLPICNDQNNLLFLTEGRHVSPESELTSNDQGLFPTVHVLCRLRGGKGGFGSLLRGAATKAGQKKTNNFDACRDMNGRRLRHVNAEKKLEEWREEEEERRLVKSAEKYLRRKQAEVKTNVNGDSAKQYVDKCKKVSEKCMAQIELSVRETYAKRKAEAGGMKGANNAKKLKIWRGKKKMEDSDSESNSDKDGSDNEGNDKSVVLNKHDMDSSSVSCEKLGETSGGDLYKNVSEENIGVAAQGCTQFSSSSGVSNGSEENIGVAVQGCAQLSSSPGISIDDGESTDLVEPDIHEMVVQSFNVVTEVVEVEKNDPECNLGNTQERVSQTLCDPSAAKEDIESITVNPEVSGFPQNINKSAIVEDKVITTINFDVENPLNFDDYSSAAEMEVLGMERLKSVLQTHGLKCGGTLQERVARLFLLKTTPLEKIPKKLLAKK